MKKMSRSGGAVLPVLGLWMGFCIASSAAPQPVLYYDFEEGSGLSTANRGTSGGSGTLVNSPAWIIGTPGIEDGGLLFNGLSGTTAGSYVETGIDPVSLGVRNTNGTYQAFTMAGWIQGGKITGDEMIFGQIVGGANWLHLGLRDRKPHFGLYGDDLQAGVTLTTGTWNHIVYQLDQANIQRIFLNGVQVARRQSSGTGIKLNNTIAIGSASAASRTIQGSVDDVVIYSNVLSFTQIQFLANGGSPTNLPENVGSGDLLYTAPTGTNRTWNLYQVIGYYSGPYLSWWQAHQQATNLFYEGVQGHLAAIHNSTENEYCRYLRNLYGTDAWIGLTDSDATNTLGDAFFPGAYESGETTVPLETRRNNGWVWVNDEDYGADTYQNWAAGEPNDSPSEDAATLRGDGFWNDYGSGIPGSGDAANLLIAIVEHDMNSPVPIPGAIVRDTVMPDSALLPGDNAAYGSFAGVWVRGAGVVDDLYDAADIIVSGQGTVISQNSGIPVVNAYDPEDGTSKDAGLFPNNSAFFADQPGILESNYVALYRGRIRIPEGEAGDYTFGVHSAAGFALRFPGKEWKEAYGAGSLDSGGDAETLLSYYDTDDSNARGVITLSAGTHDLEFLTWCDGDGRRNHELYAAKGAFKNDADTDTWRLVGHKSIGDIIFAGVGDDWTVWHSVNEPVGNLANAWTAVSNYVAIASNQSSWAEINFYDPESGQQGQLLNSTPFPWNTAADDNNKALFGLATLVIPEEITIGFGFQGDDGSRLTVSNQTWNTPLLEAVNANSVIVGDSLEHNVGTGNSRTVGSITLSAGEYPISILWWEGAGGSYLDVFQRNQEAYEGQLPSSFLYRALSTTSGSTVPDHDGLQLVGKQQMLLIVY